MTTGINAPLSKIKFHYCTRKSFEFSINFWYFTIALVFRVISPYQASLVPRNDQWNYIQPNLHKSSFTAEGPGYVLHSMHVIIASSRSVYLILWIHMKRMWWAIFNPPPPQKKPTNQKSTIFPLPLKMSDTCVSIDIHICNILVLIGPPLPPSTI